MAQLTKSLREASNDEILAAMNHESKHVSYSYADLEGELERRRTKLSAKRSFIVSVLSLIVAALSILSNILINYFNQQP